MREATLYIQLPPLHQSFILPSSAARYQRKLSTIDQGKPAETDKKKRVKSCTRYTRRDRQPRPENDPDPADIGGRREK
ncbi:hypothetical protein PSPO01_09808 [Paraphaeosphaeria sporulosa]